MIEHSEDDEGNGQPGIGARIREARREGRREGLAEGVPEFRTPEDVKRATESIYHKAACGLLTGSQASAAVRACEVWLKAHASQSDARIAALEAQLHQLEGELAAARRGQRAA